MQLVSIRISGVRRFASASTVQVAPKVVALVGPNDVGKTSFLRALAGINTSDWAAHDAASGAPDGMDSPAISAMFMLDDGDRAAIHDLPEGAHIVAYRAGKRSDGTLWADVLPEISVDQTIRLITLKSFDQIDQEGSSDSHAAMRQLLSNDIRRLSAADNDLIDKFLALIADDAEHPAPELAQQIEVFKNAYAFSPEKDALNVLVEREPAFLLYDAERRQLEGEYLLAEEPDQETPEPLVDLLALGGTNINEVREAASAESKLGLFTLQARVNRRLEELFSVYWKQDRLNIEINVVQDRLLVMVRDRDSGTFTELSGHSEGFRSFLALLAFTATQGDSKASVKPILLVDEAELHLHYDAQAALVQMFQDQSFADKVIYTTHSAGCLPEDLGSGIRQIRATGPHGSELINGIWSNDVGVQPLLIALGASSFAFGAVRRALFVEGPSDAILLPALFREVLGPAELGFQTVPGLSWLRADAVREASAGAGEAVFLVDRDAAGDAIAKELRDAKIDQRLVIALADEDETVLEDLLDIDAVVSAVNALLAATGMSAQRVDRAALNSDGARLSVALDSWYAAHKIEPLPKPLLAQELVRLAAPGLESLPRLVAEERSTRVAELAAEIRALLHVPPPSETTAALRVRRP
jgi:energy-coupling factor transporter ATP-binding protein EcfA2